MITIQSGRADHPEVVELIRMLDAYLAALYPPESNHLLDVSALLQPNVVFLHAVAAGRIVGCGAVVFNSDNEAEIKRMFVDPTCRGKGIGKTLLLALEDSARKRGATVLRLETGIHQPEALKLYQSANYELRGPFGSYQPDPLSVFMEKRLFS
jgi:putative acetyltransferase